MGPCSVTAAPSPSSPRSPDSAPDITPPPPSSETRNRGDLAPRVRSCHRHRRELPPTARADQFPVSTLTPNPQLQPFSRLIDFVSVDPIPRPTQYFAPLRLSHPAECIQNSPKPKRPFHQEVLQILAQSRKNNSKQVLMYLPSKISMSLCRAFLGRSARS